jgi:ATP-dependent Lon protease
VLFVEGSRMHGGGTLTLTGHLGDVMKESARTALSWFRANAPRYSVDPNFYKDAEIHLHVPSGAIPKDGPSAGVTMVTALASELTGRPVRGDLAMTGEITLSGRVLPVGGIKEKVLAARRVGIREVIMPRQNEKNVKEDLTEELRRELTIHYVQTVDEVLLLALLPGPTKVPGDRKSRSRVQPPLQ